LAQQSAAAAAVAQVPGDEAGYLLERAHAAARGEARSWMASLIEERSTALARRAA
jgi:hypothetical protein